jgi:hypothetical protein
MAAVDANVTWNFVLHYQPDNPYHPTSQFLNDLRRMGGRLNDPGKKTDAVDSEIKKLLEDYGERFENLTEDSKDNNIAVLISGDGDMVKTIRDLRKRDTRKSGVRNMMVVFSSKSGASILKSAAVVEKPEYAIDKWDEIVMGSRSRTV